MIPAADPEILAVAATTADDLQQLAPHVPDKVRAAVEGADPGLDADLTVWAAGTRPHLRLLGPIQARTGTTGKPTAVAKRKAFYTELLAFLVLHPQGVTIDQVVDAFGSDATQMRVHLSKVRSRLGVDPTTGGNYLPDATKSPAGIARGMGIYQLVGVLADIDLFRRLRSRGQARGTEGLVDLRAALELVTGEPFTGQRGADGRGWPTVCASINTWCAPWSTWLTRSLSRPSMRATWSWPVPPPISPCSPLLTRTPPDWTSRLSSRPRVTGNPPNAYFATTSATVPTTAMAPMTYLIEPPNSSRARRG